jgi:acyl-CoA-binding protein
VKGENPSFSICEIAKELGRRWAEMAPEVKQRYQQVSGTVLLQKLYVLFGQGSVS